MAMDMARTTNHRQITHPFGEILHVNDFGHVVAILETDSSRHGIEEEPLAVVQLLVVVREAITGGVTEVRVEGRQRLLNPEEIPTTSGFHKGDVVTERK